jgi:hypothetical protein
LNILNVQGILNFRKTEKIIKKFNSPIPIP